MTKTQSKPNKKPKLLAVAEAVTRVVRTHKPEDMEMEEWQRLLRKQFGERQAFKLNNVGGHPVFSDFLLTNPESGKTYRLAIRGDKPGDNYCSCPDFSINTLGTCKHVEFTLASLKKKRGVVRQFDSGFQPGYSEVYLSYGLKREVRFRPGSNAPAGLLTLSRRYFDDFGVLKERRFQDINTFLNALSRWKGHEVRCYDDVMTFIADHQDAAHNKTLVAEFLPQGIDSPLFDTLLTTQLYPYQRQGALFALSAGRCLLGDDMGLGKTVQAIAAAELMARLYKIEKVLIISPTSLKHQWKSEIDRFTSRSATMVEGMTPHRKYVYASDSFFKLTNYELVHRDLEFIHAWEPDLIILDEAQRIKNWKTRTARTVKSLKSTFAIVLTGTPLENRIEELHSLMEFVDCQHLGPLYRFAHNHRVTDHHGKVIGYRDLEKVRTSLKDVMIRRKKSEVLKQLPSRIDKNFFVPMTAEQMALHEDYADIVVRLVAKWRRHRFLCEADQRRLQMALACMRMVSDNTWLVDKRTLHGPKLEELEIILQEMMQEGTEKAVVFSQWHIMTDLVAKLLEANGIGYVHLNGSVPSKDRKGLMTSFREDPACRVFLSTDAGGVGLNLQSGSLLINLDIPWNPAVLEQRIARIHRMGQKKPVRIINFVSRNSIEERILGLLSFKKSLFAGVLDEDGADVVMMGQTQMEQFMSSVEEATTGLEKGAQQFEGEEREEEEQAVDDETEVDAEFADEEEKSEPIVDAGQKALNDLLAGGARFLMELSQSLAPQKPDHAVSGESRTVQPLESIVQRFIGTDESSGKPCLKIPIPEPEVVNSIVSGLQQLFRSFSGVK
ncbi:MAG TPA: DEAD/DEAH box helicase [Desulfuromonadales bacterium]|nr:DEAD/DEAH box helicase [Desulfuromonadales bacterium]